MALPTYQFRTPRLYEFWEQLRFVALTRVAGCSLKSQDPLFAGPGPWAHRVRTRSAPQTRLCAADVHFAIFD
jgi:hypothetical protein